MYSGKGREQTEKSSCHWRCSIVLKKSSAIVGQLSEEMHLQNIDFQCFILRLFFPFFFLSEQLCIYIEHVVVFCGVSNTLICTFQLAVKSDDSDIT